MKSKSIPTVRSLNKKRHYPYGERSDRVPVKGGFVKEYSEHGEQDDDPEGCRTSSGLSQNVVQFALFGFTVPGGKDRGGSGETGPLFHFCC